MIFPFWLVDESALAYGSNSWTNPASSMQLYRYMFKLYRYNFTTVDFQASCTSTILSCTGTICPLPIFQQVVPVQVWVVPVQHVHWCFLDKLYRYKFGLYRYNMSTGAFLALLEIPRLCQLFTHITQMCIHHTPNLHLASPLQDLDRNYPLGMNFNKALGTVKLCKNLKIEIME